MSPYAEQLPEWPKSGRHIMAQFDEESIVVYQAYRPAIADFAVRNQRFGGEFSYARMSWIKPNFLWMMFRCGWASKEGQERILAIRIKRPFFDELLESAVASTYTASGAASHDDWKKSVACSDVRLQWDPDHDPRGNPVERRAIQLGLRGRMLRRFGEEETVSITDMTPFVMEQRESVACGNRILLVPKEQCYIPAGAGASRNIGLNP